MKCGLLGRKLGHSYSPQIHAQLDTYSYELFEREPEDVEDFLKNGDFQGINVTIPYKKTVIPFCAELSPIASAIGSVNTIVRRPDGTLFGDNTDAFGFESLVKHAGLDVTGKKCLVLGSGGASVTVCAVLSSLGAGEVIVISRSGENNYDNIAKHSDADIIVNTTPVGMYPNTGVAATDLSLFPKLEGVLDVVYNPRRTEILLQAEQRGIKCANGLHMLVAQAKRSSEIFTGKEIAASEIDRIETILSAQMQNIVLIGMPGCGKTTVADALGKELSREVVDADASVVASAGKSIPEIFAESGEGAFRALETEALSTLGKASGTIIATGGGCVTKPENYKLLHQNGIIVWLKRDTGVLSKDGRPISQANDLNVLFEQRKGLYESFADIIVDNNGSLEETVKAILAELN